MGLMVHAVVRLVKVDVRWKIIFRERERERERESRERESPQRRGGYIDGGRCQVPLHSFDTREL